MEELIKYIHLVEILQFGALVFICISIVVYLGGIKKVLRDINKKKEEARADLTVLNDKQQEHAQALNQAAEERIQRLIQVIYSRKGT